MKKTLIGVAVISLISIVGFSVHSSQKSEPADITNQPEESSQQQEQEPKKSIRFIATGDFIAHDSVNINAEEGDGYNYLKLMDNIKPLFDSADLSFCNLPIISAGSKFPVDGYPNFNAPAEIARDMGKLGCNLVNTASNHSWDYSQDYITESVNAWNEVPEVLAVVGQNKSQEEQDKIHVIEVEGVKIAFLAYTTYSNKSAQNKYGVNMYSREFASKQIKLAKEQGAEIIIVSMRWGVEYSPQESSFQLAEAGFLANEDVDIILGHGPHVLQPFEKLTRNDDKGETFIWYSLGNFLNTQLEAEALFNGVAVMDIDIETKKVSSVELLPIYQHYEWTKDQSTSEDLLARKNVELYSLEQATQELISSNQLDTTVEQQRRRIQDTLGNQVTLTKLSDY